MATSSPTIEIIRGDDVSLKMHFKDATGADIDITGYTIFFTVKRKLSDPDSAALIKVDVTDHYTPASGNTIIPITDATTSVITEGTYYYDLQLKDTDGLISSTKRGVFNVVEDVTKRTS